jgi:hypothetical protein
MLFVSFSYAGNAQLAGAQARVATAVLQSVELKMHQIGQAVCLPEEIL